MDDEDSRNQVAARAAQRAIVAKTKQGQTVLIPLDPPKAFTFKVSSTDFEEGNDSDRITLTLLGLYYFSLRRNLYFHC